VTTQEQRERALVLANFTRLAHRELKRDILAGRLTLPAALDDPRSESLRVGRLLRTVPGVGPVKAERILRSARLGEARTCGSLTADGRSRLLRAVAGVPAGARAVSPGTHGKRGSS
jgi:hypothetical protein